MTTRNGRIAREQGEIPAGRSAADDRLAAKHNITLAIDATLLKRARAVAARRGLSVSALLAEELRVLVAAYREYEAARRRAVAMLDGGLSLPFSRSGEFSLPARMPNIR